MPTHATFPKQDSQARPVVLVVDDAPLNLRILSELLEQDYEVKVANNGVRALAIACSPVPPALILLDIMMPEMDGYEVCARLKRDPLSCDIPVIFLTAKTDTRSEQAGLALGAVDYIAKPISPPVLLARLRTHLTLKAAADFLREQHDFLEREVARRSAEMQAIQDVAILVVASLAGSRDNETPNHLLRTQFYVKALAEKLQDHPRFAATLSSANIGQIYKSAPLHDIGKVGIPDRIVLDAQRLGAAEFALMKSHTTLGRAAIEQAERRLGARVPFLQFAKEIACSHHEKWDGSGYPLGLRGDAIPVSARLMALADAYDTQVSLHTAGQAMPPHAQVIAHMQAGRASHFDPDMLDAFLAIEDSLRAIAQRYADGDDDLRRERARLAPFTSNPSTGD